MQRKCKKTVKLLFVKRVILNAGAMLIFSVSFQKLTCELLSRRIHEEVRHANSPNARRRKRNCNTHIYSKVKLLQLRLSKRICPPKPTATTLLHVHSFRSLFSIYMKQLLWYLELHNLRPEECHPVVQLA